MTQARISVTWSRREPPLVPVAVVAATATGTGNSPSRALARATIDRLGTGTELRVVEGEGWIVVLGALADLPWVDGAIYLGWDGGLLVPTTLQPSVPAALLRSALPAASLVVAMPGNVLVAPMPLRAADPLLVGQSGG
jgi:hypothetical protein